MPSSITQYKIFLASPSDLSNERILIEDVIDELNITFGEPNEINLQLLKWETHSAPGVSKNNVQEIINDDIGDSYDLFIGLLWKRFGTPTDKADSGTEEEFLRAYRRFQENSDTLQILFYFKNASISPDTDFEQLGKVQRFKADIAQNKKVLFGEYLDGDQLSAFLRTHIPQRIRGLHKNQTEKKKVKKQTEDIKVPEIIPNEEYGLLDYQEQFDESIEESNQALLRIVDSMNWINKQFTKKTNEINSLASNKNNPPSRKVIRNLMVRISKSMRTFGSRVETETPIFFDNFELAINSLQKTLEIYKSDFEVDLDEAEETRLALINLISAMNVALPSTEEFITAIENLPRMSKEINAAKIDLNSKMENLVQNIRISIFIATELLDSFDDLLDS